MSRKLRKWNRKENLVFSIDGSGLKCCGEKEWMRKKHRATRCPKFIKIHTGIDIHTRYIVFNKATSSKTHDGSILPQAIIEVGKNLDTLVADGAYDFKFSYNIVSPKVYLIIPPRSNAIKDGKTKQRNEAIGLRGLGKSKWKKDTGYHQRSLVENTFSRWKTIFGENISARNSPSQQTEVILKAVILNKMTDLGLPQWKKIELA